MSVISYPVPPFANPPIQPQFYKPMTYAINALVRGETTLVTTTINHDFSIGQQVRFVIPPTGGIRELNQVTGYITAIPMANQVTIDLDTRGMEAFNYTGTDPFSYLLPIGDVNSGVINASGTNISTTIPGSFTNISPS